MKFVLSMIAIVILCLLSVYALYSCGEPPSPLSANSDISEAQSYGAIYYFNETQNFGPVLAEFIRTHPELRVISVASLNNSLYGATRGYWVVVEKVK